MTTTRDERLSAVAARCAHVLGHTGVGFFACVLSMRAARQDGNPIVTGLIGHCWAVGLSLIVSSVLLFAIMTHRDQRARLGRTSFGRVFWAVLHLFSHAILSLGLATVILGFTLRSVPGGFSDVGLWGLSFLVLYSTLVGILPMLISSFLSGKASLLYRVLD